MDGAIQGCLGSSGKINGYLVKERLGLRGGSLDLEMKAAEVPKDLQPLLRPRMR